MSTSHLCWKVSIQTSGCECVLCVVNMDQIPGNIENIPPVAVLDVICTAEEGKIHKMLSYTFPSLHLAVNKNQISPWEDNRCL